MKKGIAWLMVSGLMALSLVLASCASKVTEEKKEVVTEKKEVVTEKKEVVTEKKEVVTKKEGVEMVVDALGRLVPKPQYGGVLNLVEASDPDVGFSRSATNRLGYPVGYMKLTNDPLLMRDLLKGPDGSREWDALNHIYPPLDILTGHLAESWEIIEPDTLIFHIRKGVHWQDKAPAYGAELTAEDVVYTFLSRWVRSGSSYPRMYPVLSDLKNPEKSIYIKPDDPWAVVMKAPPGSLALLWETVANFEYIEPKALGAIEGEGFGDWRGVVGTGPMLLTDYVRGASLTYQRNPNYWKKDPFHPQNQLPYLDGVKIFIIPDLSTRQAALRSGKIDILIDVETEDAESLKRSNPELLSQERLGGADGFSMRNDVAPFNDVRVRRAMMMAIDHDELVRDYYRGKAVKFYYPAFPIPEHRLGYVPLEQMPRSVQEQYEYHPDKAKKLLAEAGYPNGFTTSVMLDSANEESIDIASIVAAYWAKVGVTLKLDIKEPAVFRSMQTAFTYPQGVWGVASSSEYVKFTFSRVGSAMNRARINEPLIEETYKAVQAAYFDWAEVGRINREAMPKIQDLALHVKLPLPLVYNVWQPWVKGYHGEYHIDHIMQYRMAPASRWVWIDSALKKTMGR